MRCNFTASLTGVLQGKHVSFSFKPIQSHVTLCDTLSRLVMQDTETQAAKNMLTQSITTYTMEADCLNHSCMSRVKGYGAGRRTDFIGVGNLSLILCINSPFHCWCCKHCDHTPTTGAVAEIDTGTRLQGVCLVMRIGISR